MPLINNGFCTKTLFGMTAVRSPTIDGCTSSVTSAALVWLTRLTIIAKLMTLLLHSGISDVKDRRRLQRRNDAVLAK
jgi:hypothetical protein